MFILKLFFCFSSEVCVGQIQPLGILHDIFVKSKCSHPHKHCFLVHLPGKPNPACVDDVTIDSYESYLGAAGPMFRFSFYKAYGQWSVI